MHCRKGKSAQKVGTILPLSYQPLSMFYCFTMKNSSDVVYNEEVEGISTGWLDGLGLNTMHTGILNFDWGRGVI